MKTKEQKIEEIMALVVEYGLEREADGVSGTVYQVMTEAARVKIQQKLEELIKE